MAWEKPTVVEIEMNAEIGAYQADDPREPQEPVVERDEEP